MTWVALTEGAIALASDANSNFQHVGLGSLLPLGNSGTMASTSGAYDLGSSSYNWRGIYCNNLYATNQTMYVSGGSIRINGTLTVDTFVLTGTTIYVGTIYWSGNSNSAYSLYTGTSKYVKYLQTSTLAPSGTLTVAHGVTSGRSKIKSVYAAADVYDTGNYTHTFSGQQHNDATFYYKQIAAYSWDDTNVYINTYLYDEAFTITAYICVEYVL